MNKHVCTSCCEALTHDEISANEALGRDSYDNFFCLKCEDIPVVVMDAEGGHQMDCVCADCSGAELTAEND